MKIYFTGVGFEKKRLLKSIAKRAVAFLGQPDNVEIYVSFANAEEMQSINFESRGVDAVTDVLSFPALDLEEGALISSNDSDINFESGCIILGEIVICPVVAESQAMTYGHSAAREYAFLFLHGLLHLLGYDHAGEQERARMESLQDRILNELKLTRD